jgi:chromosome segregation ATPase
MSEIKDIVNSIETRFSKFMTKMNDLQTVNQELEDNLRKLNHRIEIQNQEITGLQDTVNALKTSNGLLGSDEYKRDTKLKINSLIREIDYCIAQLSD